MFNGIGRENAASSRKNLLGEGVRVLVRESHKEDLHNEGQQAKQTNDASSKDGDNDRADDKSGKAVDDLVHGVILVLVKGKVHHDDAGELDGSDNPSNDTAKDEARQGYADELGNVKGEENQTEQEQCAGRDLAVTGAHEVNNI
ncbi:hypothetical protein BC828DRAFT_387008 [Blastocladiella britannica]|nr:hypothetical protein BC828DRAFT_387008 [Blastocladiella britannica]